MGLRPVLLTGDNDRAARAVADQVGIDEVIFWGKSRRRSAAPMSSHLDPVQPGPGEMTGNDGAAVACAARPCGPVTT